MSETDKEKLIRLLKEKAEVPDSFALSEIQLSMWIHQFQHPKSTAYNVIVSFAIEEKLNLEIIQAAWKIITDRHPILFSHYPLLNDTPRLIFRSEEIKIIEFRTNEIHNHIKKFVNQPFDLQQDTLFRLGLFIQKNMQVLVIVLHHIIVDSWSAGLLIQEFLTLYQALSNQKSYLLADPGLNYIDFIREENRFLQSDYAEEYFQYWAQHLKDAPLKSILANDYVNTTEEIEGDTINQVIPRSITEPFSQFIKKQHLTEFSAYLTILFIILYKYTGQTDLVIGSAGARRNSAQFANTVGCLMNPIALRVQLDPTQSIYAAFDRVQASVIGAISHQYYPFLSLIKKLNIPRIQNTSPLYQIGFELQQEISLSEEKIKLHIKEYKLSQQEGQLDLMVSVLSRPKELLLRLRYNKKIFKRSTINLLASHFHYALTNVIPSLKINLKDWSLTTSNDLVRIEQWNNTTFPLPQKTYLDFFSESVEKHKKKWAVEFKEQFITYAELDQMSNQIARFLLKYKSLSPHLVAVFLPKSIELSVVLLSILKSGQAYLPLEINLPFDRIQYILQQSQVQCVITNQQYGAQLQTILDSKSVIICWEDIQYSELPADPLQLAVGGDDLAYVIFTSGSTGHPKGVMIPHKGMLNRLLWMQRTFNLKIGDKVLQKTPITFDVSVWELFLPFLSGATLVMPEPGGHLDPFYLSELIQQKAITDLHFVPAMLDIFIEEGQLPTLAQVKRIYCSGEILKRNLVLSVLNHCPQVKIYNLYGPTEASIDVSCYYCDQQLVQFDNTIPIGKPIDNIKFYVLDDNLKICTIEQPGELYIAGIGLADGYINNPELTRLSFICNPFPSDQSYARLYKTGDIVKWNTEGNLEYLGRNDRQIKIRGFRVELAEIESIILSYRGIERCLVAFNKKKQTLAAYYTQKSDINIENLKQALHKQLPFYMMPADFIPVEDFPLTPSGKIDIQKLLKLEHTIPQPVGSVPLTPIQIWLLQQHLPKPSHWNQAFLFLLQEKLSVDLLRQSVRHLIQQHDSLRLRFDKIANAWQQYYVEDEAVFDPPITYYDVDENARWLSEISNKEQSQLNITTGPILRLALITTKNKNYLFIAIHHLVIDAVSWRIFLEDLTELYQTLIRQKSISEKVKTSSYLQWSQMLRQYPIAESEKNYWLSLASHYKPLPLQYKTRQVENIEIDLSAPWDPYRLPNLILAALFMTLHASLGLNEILLDMEHHGRDALISGVDLSRSVGWFTRLFPIYLHADPLELQDYPTLFDKLLTQINTANQHSIYYGILRYIHRLDPLIKINSPILFNFLGSPQSWLKTSLFELANKQNLTSNVAKVNQSPYFLNINAFIKNEKLNLWVEYDTGLIPKEKFPSFVTKIQKYLNILLTLPSSRATTSSLNFDQTVVKLKQIWEILFKHEVSLTDNFFSIGGDSLLAIQLAAKAQEQGMQISSRHIYVHPTIDELAHEVSATKQFEPEQNMTIEMDRPMLPLGFSLITSAQSKKFYNYYNSILATQLVQYISLVELKRYTKILIETYDILHLRFKRSTQNNWTLFEDKNETFIPVLQYDYDVTYSFDEFYLETIQALKMQLNIEKGPNLIIALLHHSQVSQSILVLVANHGFFELFSLNLILQSIYKLHQLSKRNLPLKLSGIPSYSEWLQYLYQQGRHLDIQKQIPYWRAMAKKVNLFPVDIKNTEVCFRDLHDHLFKLLDRPCLKQLKKLANDKDFMLPLHDVLIAIFALAATSLCNSDALALDMVNTGRESLYHHDLSQIVGSTRVFVPFVFTIPHSPALENKAELIQIIKNMHQAMQYINQHPFELGLIITRRLSQEDKTALLPLFKLNVLFNYMGQLRDQYTDMQDLFTRIELPFSTDWLPDAKIKYSLTVFIAIYNNELWLSLRSSEKNYHIKTLEKLAARMQRILTLLIKKA